MSYKCVWNRVAMFTVDSVDSDGAAFDWTLTHRVFSPTREASLIALSEVDNAQYHSDGVEGFFDQFHGVSILFYDHFTYSQCKLSITIIHVWWEHWMRLVDSLLIDTTTMD